MERATRLNHDIKSPPPRMNHDCRTSKKVFHYDLPSSQSLPSISLLYTRTHFLSNFSNTIQNVSKCPEAACNRLQIRKKESQVWNKQRRQSYLPFQKEGSFFFDTFFPLFSSPLEEKLRSIIPSVHFLRPSGSFAAKEEHPSSPPRFFLFFHRFPPPTNQRGNQKSHDMTNFAAQQRCELHIFNVKPTFSTLLRSSDNGIRLEFHGYHCHESSYLERFHDCP